METSSSNNNENKNEEIHEMNENNNAPQTSEQPKVVHGGFSNN